MHNRVARHPGGPSIGQPLEPMMKRRDVLAGITLASAAITMPGLVRAAAPAIKFRDLYVRGKELTPEAQALEGQRVEMIGYMAPPLKPEVNFFVLTKLPMSTCPFCETEAQWPDDIVVAYADQALDVVRYTDLIRAEGTFETGFWTDPDTGFVSFIRLRGITYNKL
jgi:hypothetical protein